MFHWIACLNWVGANLPNDVLFTLFFEGVRLLRSKNGAGRFKNGECEGVVKTSRISATLGTFGGMKVEYEVEHNDGKTKGVVIIDDPGPAMFDVEDPLHRAMCFAPGSETFDTWRRRVQDTYWERQAVRESNKYGTN